MHVRVDTINTGIVPLEDVLLLDDVVIIKRFEHEGELARQRRLARRQNFAAPD